jgi:7,8-dihydropterin-6-yl-methyl-4-(beta-D-ribofuranosyl)aminobenzene 5'-phosphate synthase
MGLQITTLSENTAGAGGLMAEWGLSILVESEEMNILFDTGQSLSASHNADLMGIDLKIVDKIVLSHGHFDHTGGLKQILLRAGKEMEIIAHPDIWAAKYGSLEGEETQYIGIPFHRQTLESLGARFKLSRKPVKLTDSIMTTGEIPMVTEYETIEPRLVVKEGEGYKPDKLLDDQALIITTDAGLVVILGCAHHGVINTLYHARKLTGTEAIYAVYGGCHLVNATEERIWLTIAALKELGVQQMGFGHCTGLVAASIMAREFGDSFLFNVAGTSISL